MTTRDDKAPPKHPNITYLQSQGEIWAVLGSHGERITADQAISLGLALMETGLYEKARKKL